MFPEQLTFQTGVIEDIISELDQVERQTWRHRGTGELLSLTEVPDRHRDALPLSESYRDPINPEWLQAIRQAIPVRFVNTERWSDKMNLPILHMLEVLHPRLQPIYLKPL